MEGAFPTQELGTAAPYRECGTEGVTGETFTVEKYGEHLLRQGTKVRIIRGTS